MPSDPVLRNVEKHPGGADRARRLPLQLIIRYRPLGEESWRRARTKNVSRSGVLFLTDEALDPTTVLEMTLRFEIGHDGLHSGLARLRGPVVRQETLTVGTGLHAIAALIEVHELVPAESRFMDS